MKHLVVAPNAFKHALDAPEAANAICTGFSHSRLECKTTAFPVGDGGDGTCRLIHEILQGEMMEATVPDPLGRPVKASYSLINEGKTAVIEMADASGIRLLSEKERNPLLTSSQGTGELIKEALNHGVHEIILGMGGSATTDGACGMLHALGIRFLNEEGEALDPIPQQLQFLHRIDQSGKDKRLGNCKITVLCDVKNKLLGSEGAAAIFGPQKGASLDEVDTLDSFLKTWSRIAQNETGKDMNTIVSGGTAGGAAAGMYAFTDAYLVNGIEHFLQITHFEEVLTATDWLITGEGSLDEQTLSGKGPYGVAKRAKKSQIPVIGLAGKIPIQPSKELNELFDVLLPINHQALSLQQALESTAENLSRTAEAIGNFMAAIDKS